MHITIYIYTHYNTYEYSCVYGTDRGSLRIQYDTCYYNCQVSQQIDWLIKDYQLHLLRNMEDLFAITRFVDSR